MLKLPNSFTPKLKSYLETIKIPKVKDLTQAIVDELATDVKDLKKLIKSLKEDKKEAEEPFETERKKAQEVMENAKASKQQAGQPYSDVLGPLQDLEGQIRQLILDYQAEQEAKAARAAAEVARLKAEADRLKAEADAAAEKARRSGNNKDVIKAFNIEQQMKAADAEVADALDAAPVVTQVQGATTVKRVSYEVEDLLKVPVEYVEYVPNLDKIIKDVVTAFPFINDHSEIVVNVDQVPDSYMMDRVIHERVLADVRAGKEISGIKKTFTEHVMVR